MLPDVLITDDNPQTYNTRCSTLPFGRRDSRRKLADQPRSFILCYAIVLHDHTVPSASFARFCHVAEIRSLRLLMTWCCDACILQIWSLMMSLTEHILCSSLQCDRPSTSETLACVWLRCPVVCIVCVTVADEVADWSMSFAQLCLW